MYIKRQLETTISRYLKSPEIIAIVGPRQCGKTTLLKEIASHLSSSIFISFDDQRTLNMFENELDDFIALYVKGKDYLFIDEFQYSKHGGKILKRIYDSQKIKIFISGSSAIDLTVNAVKFLVGRIFVFNLYPLDFSEFVSFKDPPYFDYFKKANKSFKENMSVDIGESTSEVLAKLFEEYILFGGYPRVVISPTFEEKKEVLKNIYNTYFLREVKDVLGLVDDYKLSKLIKGLALQTGNLVEYKELSLLSEYSHVSLKKYLNFLEKTFICQFIKPYFKNKRKEIVKNPKVYFFDSGLRNAVLEDFRPLGDRVDAGALLENGIFQQLLKNGYKINYWRDKQKNEIDFVVSLTAGEIIAIEVKKQLTDKALRFSQFQENYPDVKIFLAYLIKQNLLRNVEYSFVPAYIL